MHQGIVPTLVRVLIIALAASLGGGINATPASADAVLLVEADSGRVLHAEKATYPWYPASVTKLMTAYVTLRAVKDGRITLDTMLTVSDNALAQQPSKMGFPVGTKLTVDNALKMLMVKSANDIAVVLAEGVSGSVENFASDMNRASVRLGMTQSSWVNPNGLPAEMQVTSARDMAILARALLRDFPEHELYWRISAIKFGRRVIRNYNKLIDRYPGADGMKTGFICASGYNLVASATRNGKRLIAVVLGAPSGTQRNERAASLLERGFNGGGLAWLMPSLGSVEALAPMAAEPPNLREEICGKNRGRYRTDHADEEEQLPAGQQVDSASAAFAAMMPSFRSVGLNGEKPTLLSGHHPTMPPIPVSVIPPPGAPADPEALIARKSKKRLILQARGRGRKTAVINIAAPEAGKPKAAHPAKQPAPVAAERSKPARSVRKPLAALTHPAKQPAPVTATKPPPGPKAGKAKPKPAAKSAAGGHPSAPAQP